MISAAKAAANRQNAQRSTGPRTPEGKARSAANARTHGLTAVQVLLPGEDPELFAAFRTAYFDYFLPDASFVTALVDELVIVDWRLRRVARVETVAVRQQMAQAKRMAGIDQTDPFYQPPDPDADHVGAAMVAIAANGFLTEKLPRYEAHLANRRERLLALLLAAQARRPGAEPPSLDAGGGPATPEEPTEPTTSQELAEPDALDLQNEATAVGAPVITEQLEEDLPSPVPSPSREAPIAADLQNEATAVGRPVVTEKPSEDLPASAPSQQALGALALQNEATAVGAPVVIDLAPDDLPAPAPSQVEEVL